MKLTNNQLKILLLGLNLASYEKIEVAFKEAVSKQIPLIEYLPNTNIVSPDQLGRIIADALKINYTNLNEEDVDENLLSMIPEHIVKSKGVIVFGRNEEGIKIGMTDPDDIETKRLIEKKIGEKAIVYYVTKNDLNSVLSIHKENVHDEIKKLLKDLNKNAVHTHRDKMADNLLNYIIHFGYQSKASDIHIDPYKTEIVVRLRIDGILHDIANFPKDLLELVSTRIKSLSKMRTDMHRTVQDGKIKFTTGAEDVDVRVSIIPTSEGEKIVMHFLSLKSRQFGLGDLGLSDRDFQSISDSIKSPRGMILSAGLNGSGRTTTIYGVLKLLNRREVNISSIEDPIEYNVEGVNQIQVNNKTNLTFSQGLRSILRQDPDIVFIGEISDEETANIAFYSALTGHPMLSTIHANDAATTLTRFFEMDVEPFLVASTVNIVIAQRLVRRICQKCITSYIVSKEELKIIQKDGQLKNIIKKNGVTDISKLRLYKGTGCKACGNTGFSGRLAIFEILLMTESIRELVNAHETADKIVEAAKNEGMVTMLEDGIEKAFLGVTSLLEVLRVIAE